MKHLSRAYRFSILLLLLSGLSVSRVAAQGAYAPLGTRTYHLIDRIDIKANDSREQLHTSVKPYRRPAIARYALFGDSLLDRRSRADAYNAHWLYRDNSEWVGDSALPSRKPVFKVFYREPASLYSVDVPAFKLRVNPALHFRLGLEQEVEDIKYINTRGLELRGNIDDKVGFYFYAVDNQGYYMDFVHAFIDERYQVFPKEGRTKKFKENGTDYFAARGYVDFNITRHINLLFGQDRNFIGNGYRSLIVSHAGKDFLQLKINVRVWRLHYQAITAQMQDYGEDNIGDSPIPPKYMAFHRVGVDVTKNLNLGLFESVMYGPSDSTGRTPGFDPAYLNPIIFYRAVEFNLGSIDNVMIGADWKWNFLRHFQFYGQLILDEFNINELRSGQGWWANKFGGQAGLKYIDMFGVPNLDAQLEFNLVRPYTYSHTSTASNYAHFSQPTAHPLGANFTEVLGILRYQPIPKLDLLGKVIVAAYGADTGGLNYGQNIYLNNKTRVSDYGVSHLQGVRVNYLLGDLQASYQLAHRVYAELRVIYRRESSELASLSNSRWFFGAGLRINVVAPDFAF